MLQIDTLFRREKSLFCEVLNKKYDPPPSNKSRNENIPTVTILLKGEELQDPINSHALYLLHYLFLDAYTCHCITF